MGRAGGELLYYFLQNEIKDLYFFFILQEITIKMKLRTCSGPALTAHGSLDLKQGIQGLLPIIIM
jgi:hypothetical protein